MFRAKPGLWVFRGTFGNGRETTSAVRMEDESRPAQNTLSKEALMKLMLDIKLRFYVLVSAVILASISLNASPRFSIRGVRLGDTLDRVKELLGNNYEQTGPTRISYHSPEGSSCEVSFEQGRVICVQVGFKSSKGAEKRSIAWVELKPGEKWSLRYGDSRSFVESKLGQPDETFEVISTGCVYRKLNLIISYNKRPSCRPSSCKKWRTA